MSVGLRFGHSVRSAPDELHHLGDAEHGLLTAGIRTQALARHELVDVDLLVRYQTGEVDVFVC